MGGARTLAIVHVLAIASTAHAQHPDRAGRSAAPAGKEITLSLDDAVHSAMARNPEVVRLELDTEIADAEIGRQAGLFDPVLRVDALGRRETAYAIDATTAQSPTKTIDTVGLQSSLQGRTTWGGFYALGLRANRVADAEEPGFQGPTVRFRPLYEDVLFARYTQSLRRDAGFTPNRGLVDRAKLNAELSRAERRQRVESLALDVVAAYWALVVRHERVSIAEATLAEAVKLRELVERQVKVGTAPKSDITQADVTVAARRQAVQIAELDVVDGERALLDLTYLGGAELGGDDRLVLTDRPARQAVRKDFEAELAAALAHRPEFLRARRAIDAAVVNKEIAENQSRIRVDVYAEGGLAGLAGTNVVPSSLGLSAPPALLEGTLGKSFGNLVGGEAPYFEVGLQIEVPIGNGQREAAARQAGLAVEKERAVDVRSLVAHDVRAAFQRLAIASGRLDTATENLKLAEANVAAQELRYRGGGGILFDVIRAQEDLARAQAQSVLAAAEQEVATQQLELARGTLLDRFHVKI